MKVLLLAAGLGTRLKPLTDNCPKCLLEVKGKPILGIWIDYLSEIGVKTILINTHYLANKVENYINTHKYQSNIELIYEKNILGTAGTLINNLDKFSDEDLLLIHADNYSEADIIELVEKHKSRPSYCLMTMLLFETTNPQKCGIVELNTENVLINFHEKVQNPPSNLANAAIYILSKDLLHSIRNKNYKDFSCDVIPEFFGKIYTYKTSEKIIDIGTIDDYNKANSN
jgi:mannose-1-phosphate guanylyltransferase